jgi:hypothetical protein
MTFTRYDLHAGGHLIKKIFNIVPHILAYSSNNLRYIPVVIPKSAHPIVGQAGLVQQVGLVEPNHRVEEVGPADSHILLEQGTHILCTVYFCHDI